MKEHSSAIWEIIFTLVLSLVLIFFLMGETFEVSGDSMTPTLESGQEVFAENITSKFSPIKKGDIIVFTLKTGEEHILIKRVYGLPGDELEVDQRSYKVPNDSYFVLGDNEAKSTDSRSFGYIKSENILGRALFIFRPISKFRLIL